MIEARAVAGRHALHSVDLRALRGRIHALMGPSGSGKTTLLRLLHGLEPPARGSVLLDGQPVAGLAMIRRFGLAQQQPGLLRASALSNAALPLRARGARDHAPARAWLERLRVPPDARASSLSGGEAQRVALARALVARPDVLLLDEATNQLDPESARRVEAILREEAARGAIVVLATHSVPQALRLADEVTFLDGGRVVAHGPARRVLADAPPPRVQAFLDAA